MKLPLCIHEYATRGGPHVMIWDHDGHRIAECVLRENAERIIAAVNATATFDFPIVSDKASRAAR